MAAAIQLPVYRASGTLVIRSMASLVKEYGLLEVKDAYHWLTSRKGVNLFRYFLSTMRTPVHQRSLVYTLSAMEPMHTPQNIRNAYMHEDETIGLVYALWIGNTSTGVHPFLV